MSDSIGPIGAGTMIEHYRVIRPLGAGGMGEVYLAHDTRLDRDVALKLLPAERLGDATARARLVREARMASSLNHPNICTVFEVGEDSGRAYLAMEWVEGKTLDQVIPPHGLPPESVARIGAAIAAALAYAHRQGIVHRDLKSTNVMIGADGRVKVMDFGLARRREGSERDSEGGASSLTSTGVVVGSPQYMAPEVLRGGVADPRSDLWALGVLLHEMCTGSLPFQGQSTIEVGAAILNSDPASLPPRVPANLREVVRRCLTKDPSQRYQMAEEVRAVLEAAMSPGSSTTREIPSVAEAAGTVASVPAAGTRRPAVSWWAIAAVVLGALAIVVALNLGGVRGLLRSGGGPGKIRSLAVLPLQNLSRDPEQEYFADGMTEELIASLAGLQGVSVISRTSVMKYKGTKKSLPQIARELGVDGVIEGSAMNAGGRVRITAQLIEAAHDRHLWANHYERDLKDVLALQDDVADAIAGEIRVALTPAAQGRRQTRHTVDPAAYEAYLKGRYLWNKRTNQSLEAAIEQFKRATQIDSTYALGYAALAQTYVLMPSYDRWPYEKGFALTREAAARALSLDDGLAEAHTALAEAKLVFEWDWAGAGVEFRKALELNPSDATTHHWYANYLIYSGHFEAGLKQIEQAHRLDPLSIIIASATVDHLVTSGRYAEASARVAELEKLAPDFELLNIEAFLIAEDAKDFPRAIEAHIRFSAAAGVPTEFIDELRRAYATGGERGYWSVMLGFAETMHRRGVAPLLAVARYHVKLGELEQAIDVLEQSANQHDEAILAINEDRQWEPLRSNPRFQALVRRVGIPQ